MVTPSGEAGSIGVFTGHTDLSAAMKQLGIKSALIHAGRHKVESSPYAPLTDDAREHLQSVVDDYYRQFVDDVALGRRLPRRIVRGEMFGEGRVFTAAGAVSAGMADRTGTFDGEIDRLLSLVRRKTRAVLVTGLRADRRRRAARAEVEDVITAARVRRVATRPS